MELQARASDGEIREIRARLLKLLVCEIQYKANSRGYIQR